MNWYSSCAPEPCAPSAASSFYLGFALRRLMNTLAATPAARQHTAPATQTASVKRTVRRRPRADYTLT